MGVLTDHGNSSLSAFSTQSWSLTPSTTRGRNKAEAVGIIVFVLRDMSLCNALDPMVQQVCFCILTGQAMDLFHLAALS